MSITKKLMGAQDCFYFRWLAKICTTTRMRYWWGMLIHGSGVLPYPSPIFSPQANE